MTITALGLDWLHLWDIQRPILYGTSALTLVGLAWGIRGHRSFVPFGLGLAALAAILYPLHEGMDVTVFRVLLYNGAAALMGAAGWNALLARRVSRAARRNEDPRRVATPPRQPRHHRRERGV
jgi:sugar phosphate permease